MERREEILDILRREIPFISQNYRVKRVGVFGSFAKNSANDQSDIDIVVEFEKPIGLKFVSLAEYLEKKLNRKIDLLTKEGINSIRNDEIAADIKRNIIYA
ncbi:MAG: nucleotidyltransferase family protein [Bacteroidetes bacterium]|nr:nucleotidyltransferase family protein [Bacteroidota bacterium]